MTGTLIVIRILWVFPLSAVIQRRGGARRPSWPVPAVVSWAGARGVVPPAAALSIPLTSASGAPLPRRDLILAIATAVIVVSLIVQGLTLEPLVRRAGIARDHHQPWRGIRGAQPGHGLLMARGVGPGGRGAVPPNPAEAAPFGMIWLPAASVTASTFSPEESSSTTMVCTLSAASVTGMAVCPPGAVNFTICAPGETAVYDVADRRQAAARERPARS